VLLLWVKITRRTSMEQHGFFKSSTFFMSVFISDFRVYTVYIRSGVVFLFINNSIKLKYKVTLSVHKPRNRSYISSVIF